MLQTWKLIYAANYFNIDHSKTGIFTSNAVCRHRMVPLARLGLHPEARVHDDKAQRTAAQHVSDTRAPCQHSTSLCSLITWIRHTKPLKRIYWIPKQYYSVIVFAFSLNYTEELICDTLSDIDFQSNRSYRFPNPRNDIEHSRHLSSMCVPISVNNFS